jgi:hypothetical protein
MGCHTKVWLNPKREQYSPDRRCYWADQDTSLNTSSVKFRIQLGIFVQFLDKIFSYFTFTFDTENDLKSLISTSSKFFQLGKIELENFLGTF